MDASGMSEIWLRIDSSTFTCPVAVLADGSHPRVTKNSATCGRDIGLNLSSFTLSGPGTSSLRIPLGASDLRTNCTSVTGSIQYCGVFISVRFGGTRSTRASRISSLFSSSCLNRSIAAGRSKAMPTFSMRNASAANSVSMSTASLLMFCFLRISHSFCVTRTSWMQ